MRKCALLIVLPLVPQLPLVPLVPLLPLVPLVTLLALLPLLCVLAAGCLAPASLPRADHNGEAAGLESFEHELRPAVRARLLAGERVDHGADPVALVPRGSNVVALLRGRSRLQVVAGPGLHDSAATAPFPAAMVVEADGVVVVGSGVGGALQRFDGSLHELPSLSPVFQGVSALAAGRGLIDVGSEGDVVTVLGAGILGRCRVGLGITALQRMPRHLAALSSLEHTVVVFELDDDGVPICAQSRRADFDGLLFTLVAREAGAGGDVVEVVVSGVEDHALDRSGGSFGNIDSFLFGLRFDDEGVTRVWETNLSERHVVNGKALVFQGAEALDRSSHVVVWGAGSGRFAVVDVDGGAIIATGASLVGVSAGLYVNGQPVVASVIEDAVTVGSERIDLGRGASALQRLGERLVFTTLMAPQQRSEGPLSRFTCETCHLGGGADGRVHNTGRGTHGEEITATTKPLWGLFENPPLFTRALDRSVAVMVHAEFKVANARSPQDPWFSAHVSDDGSDDGSDAASDEVVGPLQLRRALIAFFAGFDPPANPRAFARDTLNDDEARGWQHFKHRCLRCHDARVFADEQEADPDFDVVSALLHGALVFGRAGREDTGVRPRVHPEGARPSSLRGISNKVPLLTNGSARDLPALLKQARTDGDLFTHQGSAGAPLDEEEQRLLLLFLPLL